MLVIWSLYVNVIAGPLQLCRVQVYDLDTNIDVIKHHGSTDPLILVGILMHHGIAKEDVRSMMQHCLAWASLSTDTTYPAAHSTQNTFARYSDHLRTLQFCKDACTGHADAMHNACRPLRVVACDPELRCCTGASQGTLTADIWAVRSAKGDQPVQPRRSKSCCSPPDLPLAAVDGRIGTGACLSAGDEQAAGAGGRHERVL